MTETTWEYTIPDVSPFLSYSGNGYNTSNSGGSNSTGWTQLGCVTRGPCNPSSSAHQTRMSGASVSLTFYGQSVRLFGNVTGGMQYIVKLDDVSLSGTPSDQLLASASMLTPGYHTIGVTANPPSDGGILTFQSASVTVGTGLTGAQVISNIIQDGDASIQYSSGWIVNGFITWGIQHTTSNETWHELGSPGFYSVRFSANAIMVYGFSWVGTPSVHQFSLDNDPPTTIFANSSLTVPDTFSASGLAFFRANLSGSSHYLTVTNEGVGNIGLDYIQFLSVTGGTPLGVGSGNSTVSTLTPGHSTSPGIIAGAVVGGLLALIIALIVYIKRDRIKVCGSERSGPSGQGEPD